jgi:hypothetical protein
MAIVQCGERRSIFYAVSKITHIVVASSSSSRGFRLMLFPFISDTAAFNEVQNAPHATPRDHLADIFSEEIP